MTLIGPELFGARAKAGLGVNRCFKMALLFFFQLRSDAIDSILDEIQL